MNVQGIDGRLAHRVLNEIENKLLESIYRQLFSYKSSHYGRMWQQLLVATFLYP